jgi:hypothetical protein
VLYMSDLIFVTNQMGKANYGVILSLGGMSLHLCTLFGLQFSHDFCNKPNGKDYLHKTKSDRTLRNKELCAPGCHFLFEFASYNSFEPTFLFCIFCYSLQGF